MYLLLLDGYCMHFISHGSSLFPIVTSRYIDSEGIYPFLALDRDIES